MKPVLNYIDAQPNDHVLLTATAFASKKMWGYPDELMLLWKADLKISESYISENKVVKVFVGDEFIGFFGLKKNAAEEIEIDHLWLLSQYIKKGFGRIIFNYILSWLQEAGYTKTTLIAEPNAKGFYDKMGGSIKGKFQSKIKGRVLDIYEFDCGKAS